MATKLWAVVTGLGKRSIFGYTPDHESVVFKLGAEGLAGVRRGDIVEFVPSEFRGGDQSSQPKPVKWFGSFPVIIARNAPETEANNPATRPSQKYKGANPRGADTRPRPDAVVWKQQEEQRADAAAFSETFQK